MLSKDEIQENTKTLPLEKYGELLSENYLSQSARLKCTELEAENKQLRKELEKFKMLAGGDISEKTALMCQLYDGLLNESDIISESSSDTDFSEILKTLHSDAAEGNTSLNDRYENRKYEPSYKNISCRKCSDVCKKLKSSPLMSVYIDDEGLKVIDEEFPVYKCVSCGEICYDMYEKFRNRKSLLKEREVTAQMAAFLLNEKFVMKRSYAFLENSYRSQNMTLSKEFMSYIVNEICDRYLEPLYNCMKNELFASGFIISGAADVLTCRVNEKEASSHDEGMLEMFVYTAEAVGGGRIILFDAGTEGEMSENSDISESVKIFLRGYSGIIHTDKAELFDYKEKKFEILPMWGAVENLLTRTLEPNFVSGKPDANVIKCISSLGKIKQKLKDDKDVDDEIRLAVRRANCSDITDELIEKAQEWEKNGCKIKTEKAFRYILEYMNELDSFYTDARTVFDNESCEEELNEFGVDDMISRIIKDKNGYRRTVIIMSIIRTVKANSLDVVRYLTFYLKNILIENNDVSDLLPWKAPSECCIPMERRADEHPIY